MLNLTYYVTAFIAKVCITKQGIIMIIIKISS